jgi:hypothetical protein
MMAFLSVWVGLDFLQVSLPGKSAKRVFALDDPAIHPL